MLRMPSSQPPTDEMMIVIAGRMACSTALAKNAQLHSGPAGNSKTS